MTVEILMLVAAVEFFEREKVASEGRSCICPLEEKRVGVGGGGGLRFDTNCMEVKK